MSWKLLEGASCRGSSIGWVCLPGYTAVAPSRSPVMGMLSISLSIHNTENCIMVSLNIPEL